MVCSNAIKFCKVGTVSVSLRGLTRAEAEQRGVNVTQDARDPLEEREDSDSSSNGEGEEKARAEAMKHTYSPALPQSANPPVGAHNTRPIIAIELSVRDTGAGIEPELLPRLFEGELTSCDCSVLKRLRCSQRIRKRSCRSCVSTAARVSAWRSSAALSV